MIVPEGLQLFSELDAHILSEIREKAEYKVLIEKAIEAPPLRSIWASEISNTIDMSLKQSNLRAELQAGLSVVLHSNFLFKKRGLLRLYNGRSLFAVSEDVISTSIESCSLTSLSDMRPSYLQEELRRRGRARARMFTYLTPSWTVRNLSDFQMPDDWPDHPGHMHLRDSLATMEGSHLCVISDRNLHKAFAFAESSPGKITKEMLAVHLNMEGRGSEFEAIWLLLKTQTFKMQGRGRPRKG